MEFANSAFPNIWTYESNMKVTLFKTLSLLTASDVRVLPTRNITSPTGQEYSKGHSP